jgi:hypothetical protein
MWHPLNVTVATPYWQDASWRESWQAAMATAAYSCNRTVAALVFQLENGWQWQRLSGFGFRRQWILNYVILVFVFCIRKLPSSYQKSLKFILFGLI